jgi:hypothetical protein
MYVSTSGTASLSNDGPAVPVGPSTILLFLRPCPVQSFCVVLCPLRSSVSFLCPVQQVRRPHAAIVPRRQGTTFINGRMSSLYNKSGRYQFVYNFIHICQHGILLTGHKCVTYKKRLLGDLCVWGTVLDCYF